MPFIYYITHPDVVVDQAVPIQEWDLSPHGRERLAVLLAAPWVNQLGALYCSREVKSMNAAGLLGATTGIQPQAWAELGEIDRSATGYLPPDELEPVVEALYHEPHQSVRGWERAVDAQRRVVDAVTRIDRLTHGNLNVAIVGHGGVGTLLMAAVTRQPISRSLTAHGQGNYFVIERGSWRLVQGWQAIDQAQPC